MIKVLCLGSTGKDIFFPTAEGKIIDTPEDLESQKKIAFELGAKVKVAERHESLGGCAANAAVALTRLGVESFCASSVGSDMIGNWAKEELKNEGVGVDLMKISASGKSDLSAIVVDENSGERTIFTNKNSDGSLDLDAEKVREADWFFVSDIYGKWEDELETIFELAKNENKKVAFNPREAGIREDAPEIIEAIGLCEILFVNKDEAIEIVSNMHTDANPENVNDEKYLLEKLKSLEVKIVALTDGMCGAWTTDGQNTFHAPALVTKALDTTGAGDAFASAFLAAYIKGKDIQECLRWGIVESANEVQFYGAINGLLKETEILEKVGDVKTERL
ncbi:MAG: carbohydrate kinase family protein [Candidatus Pacebacteria bacterium]|nr:carbohydrate kinase family protein [Candidatus Paceibacterota bacterium]MDR3583552.1 carbohydrate kinase family protein [Candidatus Paceibacterota bacterium]